MPIPTQDNLSSTGGRIGAVDAARGCAMLMVCASHIKGHLVVTSPTIYWLLVSTTRIATPTFLLISGFAICHFLHVDARGRASVTLLDRALFLLIVGHALLGLADLPQMAVAEWVFGRAAITDAVGVALFVAVLMRRAPGSVYMALGLALCLVSWTVAITATPESEWAQLAGAVLFQLRDADHPLIDLPIVGYVGVFLLGMGLRSGLQRPLLEWQPTVISRRLLRYGLGGIALALVGVVTWNMTKHQLAAMLGDADVATLVRRTLDPRGKRPPSPAYLMFYGGLGLLILALFFYGRPARLVQPMMSHMAVIGRASLMCFVVQDWLFFVVPAVLGLNAIHSAPFWLAYLTVCLIALYALARIWDARRGNRFLTVGLKALARRQRAS